MARYVVADLAMGDCLRCVAFGVTGDLQRRIKSSIDLPEKRWDWYSVNKGVHPTPSGAGAFLFDSGDTGEEIWLRAA